MKPGTELDLKVAEKMGLVPCSGWESTNFGSAGGPALMSTTCVHASGACYPTVESGGMWGSFGGVPKLSDDDSPLRLRLRDFPGEYTLYRIPNGFSVEDSAGNCWLGETEAHALCLAYLDAEMEPKFTEENRWHQDWLDAALQYGLVTHEGLFPRDLPEPWTPEAVLALHRAIMRVRGEADSRVRMEEAKKREAKLPKRKRTITIWNPPDPPQTNEAVQAWLWKMKESGLGDAEMAKVNEVLKRVWEDPEDTDHGIL